jgi:fructokinase
VKDREAYRDGVMKAMRHAHILKVSDEDLGHLGLGDLSLAELSHVLFHESNTELVALTLGSRGAVLLARSAHTQMPAPADLAVVDTVGAGDCFHAGLIAYLHRSGALASPESLSRIDADCLEYALRHAIACASLNIMRAGCQPPNWEEAKAFARTMS